MRLMKAMWFVCVTWILFVLFCLMIDKLIFSKSSSQFEFESWVACDVCALKIFEISYILHVKFRNNRLSTHTNIWRYCLMMMTKFNVNVIYRFMTMSNWSTIHICSRFSNKCSWSIEYCMQVQRKKTKDET